MKTLLSIDYWPFESFEVFERLEVIHGQHGLWRNVAALFLANNDANSETETPQMKEFGLKSLKSIENGNVIIMANEFKDSCHVTTIDWTKEDFTIKNWTKCIKHITLGFFGIWLSIICQEV